MPSQLNACFVVSLTSRPQLDAVFFFVGRCYCRTLHAYGRENLNAWRTHLFAGLPLPFIIYSNNNTDMGLSFICLTMEFPISLNSFAVRVIFYKDNIWKGHKRKQADLKNFKLNLKHYDMHDGKLIDIKIFFRHFFQFYCIFNWSTPLSYCNVYSEHMFPSGHQVGFVLNVHFSLFSSFLATLKKLPSPPRRD